jgi:hypothetical protein
MSDTPAPILRTVTPRRVPNQERRTREYLTPAEVAELITQAKAKNGVPILTGRKRTLRNFFEQFIHR